MTETLDTSTLDPKIAAALIAGAVSLFVAFLTSWLTGRRLQLERDALNLKLEEFEQRRRADSEDQLHRARELSLRAEEVRSALAAAKQGLDVSVLERRAEAYAALYPILQRHNRIHRWERKPLDHGWVMTFLRDLHEVNARYGVFFSEPVYAWFGLLRNTLHGIEERLRDTDAHATAAEIELIDGAISGPLKPSGREREPGLGTAIKNDLGSYMPAALSAASAP